VTAADLSRIASQVPQTPEFGAMALVDLILGVDVPTSEIATAELLRRCGLALVHADGPVLALPSDVVIATIPVYVELVPNLARAVREQRFHTAEHASALLSFAMEDTRQIDADSFVQLLGFWGKSPYDIATSRCAGAAVRALSGRRGEVLHAQISDQLTHIDPLQLFLLMSHMCGATYECAPPAAAQVARKFTARETAAEEPANPCAALSEQLERVSVAYKAGKAPGVVVWNAFDYVLNPTGVTKKGPFVVDAEGPLKTAWDEAKWAVVDAIKEGWGDKVKEWAESMHGQAEIFVLKHLTAVVSLYLYLTAFTLKISSDEGTAGHYRPADPSIQGHDKTTDFHLTAHAEFDPGANPSKFTCYALAGLHMPSTKELPGDGPWRILWSIATPSFPWLVNALAHVKGEEEKFDAQHDGAPLDADGESRVHLYPRTEAHPGVGAIQTVKVEIAALLRSTANALQLEAFLELAELEEGIRKIAMEALIGLLSNWALPTAHITLNIGRHAPDIYVIKGSSPDLTLLMVNLPVFADLYSCGGLKGPWKGRAGATIQGNEWTDAMTTILQEAPVGTHPINEEVTLELDPTSTTPQERPVTEWMNLEVTITNPPKNGEHLNGIVGSTDFTINGGSTEAIASMLGISSTNYCVKGVPHDPRCPDADPEQDTFDGD
jgi:hypothetical protein